MSESGTSRVLSKKQKEEHKEEIVKWLLENYLLAADRALPRDVVYQHYCSFCRQKAIYMGGRSFFTKIFAVPFPCLPSRRLGARGDTRLFYDGLDIHPNSDFYSKVARERLVTPQPMTRVTCDSSRKVCSFRAMGHLHKTKHLPVTICTVDPDLHLNTPSPSRDGEHRRPQRPGSLSPEFYPKRALKDGDTTSTFRETQTSSRPGSMPGISQDRLEELDHLLSPTEANDQILEFLNLSGGTEEQISRMAEELLSQDAHGHLSELMMGGTELVRPEEGGERQRLLGMPTAADALIDSSTERSFLHDNSQPVVSPLVVDDSPHSSYCSNDSGISIVHEDSNPFSVQCASPPDQIPTSPNTSHTHSQAGTHPNQGSPTKRTTQWHDETVASKRLKFDAMDLNSNSLVVPACSEHKVVESSAPLAGEGAVPSWRSLSEDRRKFFTERVLTWLEEEYDIAPLVCVPRQTVYKHYLAFCGDQRQPVANIKVFGKMLQKKFPSLSMRRLGGRGESRYFYMGIDILETSCHYATMRDQRVFGTTDKPKRSLVTFDKRAIKNTII